MANKPLKLCSVSEESADKREIMVRVYRPASLPRSNIGFRANWKVHLSRAFCPVLITLFKRSIILPAVFKILNFLWYLVIFKVFCVWTIWSITSPGYTGMISIVIPYLLSFSMFFIVVQFAHASSPNLRTHF